jgi:hypothetical protein
MTALLASLPALAKYKVAISAVGLIGLGLYQLSQGDAVTAIQSVLGGLGIAGLHLGAQKSQ